MEVFKILDYLGNEDGDDMMSVGSAQLWFACKDDKPIFEITLDHIGSWVIHGKQMEDLIKLLKKFELEVLLS